MTKKRMAPLSYRALCLAGGLVLFFLLRMGANALQRLTEPGLSPFGNALLSALSYLVMMGFPLLLLVFLLEMPRRKLLPLRPSPRGTVLLLPASLGGLVLLNLLGSRLADTLFSELPLPDAAPVFSQEPAAFTVELLSCTVLPAFLEEFLFRGVLLRALLPAGEKTAVLLSALVFTLCHASPAQWLPALGAGLWFGFVTLRTGTLRPTVRAHFWYNVFAAVSALAPGPLFHAVLPVLFIITGAVTLPAAVKKGLLRPKAQPKGGRT